VRIKAVALSGITYVKHIQKNCIHELYHEFTGLCHTDNLRPKPGPKKWCCFRGKKQFHAVASQRSIAYQM